MEFPGTIVALHTCERLSGLFPNQGIFVKSLAELESALSTPMQHMHYRDDVPMLELAAIMMHAIAINHPLNNGNKRLATLMALCFLSMNKVPYQGTFFDHITDADAIFITLMAKNEYTIENLENWLRFITS